MKDIGLLAGSIAVAVIAIAIICFDITGTATTSSASQAAISNSTYEVPSTVNNTVNVPVGMIAPSSLPQGIQSVMLTYESVQVHTVGSNGGGWFETSGIGIIYPLSLTNASQSLTVAQVAENSTVNAVRLYITSAEVVINGTTYNATAPAVIMANITGNTTIHANSAILLELVTNITVNTNLVTNKTTYTYAASPAKAVLVTNASVSGAQGAIVSLNSTLKAGLGLDI